MNVKQLQHLLAYLGYYTSNVDGIWGDMSRQATEDFQRAFYEAEGDITVDGVPGPETYAALKYAVANDMFKVEKVPEQNPEQNADKELTGTFWDDSEFFDREEFRCQCGGRYCNGFPVEPTKEIVRTVNEIRRRLGVPVSIVDAGGSGVRCPVHNANVGGVANSNHLTGNAADLHSDKSPQEMYQVAEGVLGNTGELGIYDWGIHVGVNCAYSRFAG